MRKQLRQAVLNRILNLSLFGFPQVIHPSDFEAISWYPNAGLPNPMSDTGCDETPEVTSCLVGEFAAEGLVNIVGGCCGTTPAHIGAIHDKVAPLVGRVLQRNVFYREAA